MKIILAGSGSGGPIAPLIAVWQKIKSEYPEAKFLLVGDSRGPAKKIAIEYGLDFVAIPVGKWRRYFSLANLASPFQTFFGFFKALQIVGQFKPDVIFGAGGYVCVPLMYAGKLRGAKIVIHQQDVLPSLTNRLLMPIADRITVSFADSVQDFETASGLFSIKNKKVALTGNPVRAEMFEPVTESELAKLKQSLKITEQLPIILVIGGATGAATLNAIVVEALPELCKSNYVIHVTGPGKLVDIQNPHYIALEYVDRIANYYRLSDLLIVRAGMGTISELAALKKAAIVVPMPDSHQLQNAEVLYRNRAAVVISQEQLDGKSFILLIRKMMYDGQWQSSLRENISQIMPSNASSEVAKIITDLCKK